MDDFVVLVSGSWIFHKNKWQFVVDMKKGSKLLAEKDCTRFDDVLQIVCEDYEMERKRYEPSLSYMFPKKMMRDLPRDTPPIFVENSKQLHEFLLQCKSDPIRLCVEFYEKEISETAKNKASRGRKHARREEHLAKGPGGDVPATAPPPAQTAEVPSKTKKSKK